MPGLPNCLVPGRKRQPRYSPRSLLNSSSLHLSRRPLYTRTTTAPPFSLFFFTLTPPPHHIATRHTVYMPYTQPPPQLPPMRPHHAKISTFLRAFALFQTLTAWEFSFASTTNDDFNGHIFNSCLCRVFVLLYIIHKKF